jgi:hypothetical protein
MATHATGTQETPLRNDRDRHRAQPGIRAGCSGGAVRSGGGRGGRRPRRARSRPGARRPGENHPSLPPADATDPTVAGLLLERHQPQRRAQRRVQPTDPAAAPPDVADVRQKLGYRCAARLPLGSGGASLPLPPGRPSSPCRAELPCTVLDGAAIRRRKATTIRLTTAYAADQSNGPASMCASSSWFPADTRDRPGISRGGGLRPPRRRQR